MKVCNSNCILQVKLKVSLIPPPTPQTYFVSDQFTVLPFTNITLIYYYYIILLCVLPRQYVSPCVGHRSAGGVEALNVNSMNGRTGFDFI